MPGGYSQSPTLLKGALIQFGAPMLVPIPNIIVFQYNPETLTRTLTPWGTPEDDHTATKDASATAQPFDPKENFNVSLELDATDALEDPGSHPVAVLAGVGDRLAALEMLCYPPGESALAGLLNVSVSVSVGGLSASLSAKVDTVPRTTVPVVLFFWGPGRIVPVRLTSFSVEEQAFSPTLYPIRAKVAVGMKVLDANAFGTDSSAIVKIAEAAYKFTRAQKELLATANLANSVESIMGMLPL